MTAALSFLVALSPPPVEHHISEGTRKHGCEPWAEKRVPLGLSHRSMRMMQQAGRMAGASDAQQMRYLINPNLPPSFVWLFLVAPNCRMSRTEAAA